LYFRYPANAKIEQKIDTAPMIDIMRRFASIWFLCAFISDIRSFSFPNCVRAVSKSEFFAVSASFSILDIAYASFLQNNLPRTVLRLESFDPINAQTGTKIYILPAILKHMFGVISMLSAPRASKITHAATDAALQRNS